MIRREKNNNTSYNDLIKNFSKIGDPYLTNVYVRKCIDYKASMIAGVGFTVVNSNDEELPESAPIRKLFNYINDDDSPYDFIFEIARYLYRFGKSHIRLSNERTAGNVPLLLDVLNSEEMKPELNNGILLNWKYKNKKTISKDNIVFIRKKHPSDPYDGLSPGSAAVKELLQDFYAQAYQIKYFQNGAMGSGFFYDPSGKPLTAAQENEARFAVDQTFNRGVDGAGRAQILKRKLEYQKTSDTARDQQFSLLLQWVRDSIYVCYGTPKVIFASSEATYANLFEAKKMLWTQELKPDCRLIEDAINKIFFQRLLKSTDKFTFKLSEVPELQDDLNKKLDSALKLYQLGLDLTTIDEMLDLNIPESGLNNLIGESAPVQDDPEKTFRAQYIEQKRKDRIKREKRIPFDEILLAKEYKNSLEKMISGEAKIKSAVKRFFSKKYKLAENRLNKTTAEQEETEINADTSVSIEKAIDKDEWIQEFLKWLDGEKWSDEFVSDVDDSIKTVYRTGARRSYAGVGRQFNQPALRAVQHMVSRMPKLKNVTEEFKSIIANKIGEIMKSDSWTIETMRKDISKIWKDVSDTRARLTSRTETTIAFNHGRLDGMKEVGIKQKQYLTSRDKDVRDNHMIDGQIVKTDEPFILVDGSEVMFPGDGDAKDVCNCRCTIISVL